MSTLPARWLVALIVIFAGFCSLVYQVVWERTVKYNFGGDATSSAIVTATFLLGLGIGAVLFGRWRRRPFGVFAVVELALGAYAVVSYHVLAPLAAVLGQLFHLSIADAEGLRAPLVLGCVLFLLPPCVLIGGTLPLMFNCFIPPRAYQGSTIGLLYGLNTAGAALGVLAAPFLFLNRMSIPATLVVVGSGNLLIGAAIWLYGRRVGPPADEVGAGDASAADSPAVRDAPAVTDLAGAVPLLLALAFVSGFISLAFEVSLFRAFVIFNPSSPYNFPGVLLPFLLSIAVGSVLFTRFRGYSDQRALRRVGLLFVLGVVAMLLGVVGGAWLTRSGLLFEVFRQSPFGPTNHFHGLLAYGLVLIVPFVLLLSGAFPLLLRLASPTGRSLPATTGRISLVNALGAFGGAMLAQFVGFPLVGTPGVVSALFWLGLVAGGACLWKAAGHRRQTALLVTVIPLLALAPLLVPSELWDLYTFGRTGPNVERVEGTTGVATIDWGLRGRVFVGGQSMSALPDHPVHVQLVSFALALPRRERVLLLGLGGGGMVRELARDPGIRQVDVVDWSYELPRVLDTPRAREMLEDVFRHPKVRLYRCDARVAVSLYAPETFDVVIDNLTHAHWVGATHVKSVAYFARIRRIVKPSGTFVYHGNYGNARQAVLAGLARNFPVVQEHGSRVVFASEHAVEIDRARAQEVLEPRAQAIGVPTNPYSDWLLTDWGRVTADQLGVSAIRDHLPIYEYQLDPFAGLLPTRRRQ